MPELPEVETIARDLRDGLVGRRVSTVATSGLKLRALLDDRTLAATVGLEVRSVERRGKYLLIALGGEAGVTLVGHLGMSGRLGLCESSLPVPPHTHLRFGLDQNQHELRYTDPRRFGLWRCYPSSLVPTCAELSVLGPDPLEPRFDPTYLHRELKATRRALKLALLDQGLVAGLGNIYVCEALYHARLSPFRRGEKVSRPQAARLHGAIVDVISRAIQNRGTTFSDYVDARGEAGQNQLTLAVFQRDGQGCHACGAAIRRRVQGARSTFFCPVCQRY
jgi:formamidopyrimidine-DNA glycosylase